MLLSSHILYIFLFSFVSASRPSCIGHFIWSSDLVCSPLVLSIAASLARDDAIPWGWQVVVEHIKGLYSWHPWLLKLGISASGIAISVEPRELPPYRIQSDRATADRGREARVAESVCKAQVRRVGLSMSAEAKV